MYPFVQEKIDDMIQRTIDVSQKLPENHWFRPEFLNPIQKILPDSDIPCTSTSSQPTTRTSDPFVLEELANHYQGELQGFRLNLETTSEIVPDISVSKSPQQHQPNTKMAINSYSELIIHPEYKPYHLNATHSNISFGIALRNIANKRSFLLEQSISDSNPSLSEDPIFVVQPLSVALPSESSEAILNPQSSVEPPYEPSFMIITNSDAENEQTIQTGTTLDSSLPFVLESFMIHPLYL